MKKRKVILIALLTMCMCVTTTTFSWFTRPIEENGAYFKWFNNSSDSLQYSISTAEVNNLSMVTYEMQGDLYDEENPITNFNLSSSENIATPAEGRRSYRTDITNNGATPLSASLFISSLTIGDGSAEKIALGVNSPLKTFKHYGSTNDIPIATNFIVNSGETVSIHWFIMNDSKDKALYYTIEDVYLTL